MNFELKFSSSKGTFSLNVDFIAVLRKALIPAAYLVPSESDITTTDEAAISHITQHLLSSPISQCGDTEYALLVQANGSRWLLFGVVGEGQDRPEDQQTVKVMKIQARMIGGHLFNGIQRPKLEPGKNVFLVRKVKSALDEHLIKSKKRKKNPVEERTPEPILDGQGSKTLKPATTITQSRTSEQKSAKVEHAAPNLSGMDETARSSRTSPQADGTGHKEQVAQTTEPATVSATAKGLSLQDKSLKDKLKKMIITLLSLQGIQKQSSAFKDLYQHTLQASTFALKSFDGSDKSSWERHAMAVNQSLIKIFMGNSFKDPS